MASESIAHSGSKNIKLLIIPGTSNAVPVTSIVTMCPLLSNWLYYLNDLLSKYLMFENPEPLTMLEYRLWVIASSVISMNTLLTQKWYFFVVIDDRLRVVPIFPRNNLGRNYIGKHKHNISLLIWADLEECWWSHGPPLIVRNFVQFLQNFLNICLQQP